MSEPIQFYSLNGLHGVKPGRYVHQDDYEALQATLARVEGERNALRVNASNDYCQIQDLGKCLAQAEQERDRLREQLAKATHQWLPSASDQEDMT